MYETNDALEKEVRRLISGQILMLIVGLMPVPIVLIIFEKPLVGIMAVVLTVVGASVGWGRWMLGLNDCKKADHAYGRAFNIAIGGTIFICTVLILVAIVIAP